MQHYPFMFKRRERMLLVHIDFTWWIDSYAFYFCHIVVKVRKKTNNAAYPTIRQITFYFNESRSRVAYIVNVSVYEYRLVDI